MKKLLLLALVAGTWGCGGADSTTETAQEDVGQVAQGMASCELQFQICWSACEDGAGSTSDLWTWCHNTDFSGLCDDEKTTAEKTECEAIMLEACMKGGDTATTLASMLLQNCLAGCATKQTACLESAPVCKFDANCGTGNMCIANKCYKKCSSSLTCRAGEVCTYYSRGKVCMAN